MSVWPRPLHGHWHTFRPFVRQLVRATPTVPSRHWRTFLDDPDVGRVRLTGRLHEQPGDELLVVVHGLGGSHQSIYTLEAARAAASVGVSCLRLNLRGADRKGRDYYHAGLTADLRAALASDELARFRRVYVLGYSLGGHLVLRYASEGVDPRVRAVATNCAPVDLAAGADEIDRPKGAVYRSKVLGGLKEIYAEVAKRRDVPIPVAEAERIRTLREWDTRVVAPRFGFSDADEYYATQSAGPVLDRIVVPALAVVAERDPMVFAHTVRPHLEPCGAVRSVFVARGGHVGFPSDVDLGLGGRGDVESQTLAWLRDPH
ncbi:MAG: alpha/beta fold hydrolase [Sandaracinus sp.]|nr:alpha/beta fold hydrolase [Sandaracinus sp.]